MNFFFLPWNEYWSEIYKHWEKFGTIN
jgi:hypothetical protein